MHDDQLREQFASWAEPLVATAPPDLSVLRRRARRRTVARAAISGLAVTGAAAAIALSGFPRAGHAAPAAAAPAMPPYAVLLERAGQDASVLDMATGKVLGEVARPVPRSEFEWVAAASDDRTFVLADQSQAQVTRFYLLHLAANGKPGPLVELAGSPLYDSQVYGMALTADASKLAVAWQNNPPAAVSSHISVTTLATGATRTWTSASGGALAVSWAGDRTVAFDWQDTLRQARSGVRLLDTAAPGFSLLATRLVIPATTRTGSLSSPSDPLITQDGSAVFAIMAAGTAGTKTAIVRFSAGSGMLQAVLTPATGQSQWYCGILWADPRGRQLLTQCGTTQASIDGSRSSQIRLHQLIPASPVGFANTFAW